MAQAILADVFPPRQRGLAFALYGITAILAPTVGPTLGGWITDNYSWHWIFFINVPVGALTFVLVSLLVSEPAAPAAGVAARARLDYVGIGLLVLGVGTLQILLDKGQEEDWFGSPFITALAIVAGVCLVVLAIWEWLAPHPIIDVRLFRNVNFLSANFMMFMLGVVLFASIVLMPLFLQTLLGYTAEVAGLALSLGGLVLLMEMPVIGQLTSHVQARYLIAVGWLALAVAMVYSALGIDLLVSFASVARLRVLQVIGLGFLFVPITLAAYVGMPAEKNNSVAGIVNFMRNMGSSVGTSLVTTLTARRAQVHQAYLVSRVAADNPAFQDQVRGLAGRLADSGMSAPDARRQAYARFYFTLQQQAQTLAYVDVYWFLAAATVLFFLSFLLKRNEPGGGGGAAVG